MKFLAVMQLGMVVEYDVPQMVEPFHCARKVVRETSEMPKAIIVSIDGKLITWRHGADYFDQYQKADDVQSVIESFMSNLDGKELAELFTHVTGGSCEYIEANGLFGYNTGGE